MGALPALGLFAAFAWHPAAFAVAFALQGAAQTSLAANALILGAFVALLSTALELRPLRLITGYAHDSIAIRVS